MFIFILQLCDLCENCLDKKKKAWQGHPVQIQYHCLLVLQWWPMVPLQQGEKGELWDVKSKKGGNTEKEKISPKKLFTKCEAIWKENQLYIPQKQEAGSEKTHFDWYLHSNLESDSVSMLSLHLRSFCSSACDLFCLDIGTGYMILHLQCRFYMLYMLLIE